MDMISGRKPLQKIFMFSGDIWTVLWKKREKIFVQETFRYMEILEYVLENKAGMCCRGRLPGSNT
jgi:hypothetical protein